MREQFRKIWLFLFIALIAMLMWSLAPEQAEGGEGNPRLSFWRVDGQNIAPSSVSKPYPTIMPLIDEPPALRRLALQSEEGTWCSGLWQGDPFTRSVGWVIGIEVFAAYQDPAELLCENTYPFDISDVYWIMQVDFMALVRIQPVIASNAGTPECPFPGDLLCLGEMDSLIFAPGTWLIQMPLDSIDCIVDGPYFAGIFLPDEIPAGTVDLVFDAATGSAAMPCRTYDDWGDGWQDLTSAFPNMILWSEGTTAGAACACDSHGDPASPGVTDVFDVLQAVNVAFQNGTPVIDPGCQVQNIDINGCNGVVDVFDVLFFVDVAFQNGSKTSWCNPCP